MAEIHRFDIDTCAEDFAGDGREIEPWRDESPNGYVRQGMRVVVNGWELSAIWGFGSYCTGARRLHAPGHIEYLERPDKSSPDCEVAVWRVGKRATEGMIHLDSDTVAGWVKPARVAAMLDAMAASSKRRTSRDEARIRAAANEKQTQEVIANG